MIKTFFLFVFIILLSACENKRYTNIIELETQKDETAPLISIKGDNPMYLHLGQTYHELGVAVIDNADREMTYSIIKNTINTKKTGTYYVTYQAKDSANNTTEATRMIYIKNKENLLF